MSVTKCLKCDEPVLIPSGASLKATVRCPLCHEQFELGEMLDEVPPPLEIVQDPDAVAVAEVQPFSFDSGGKSDDQPADAGSFAGVGDESDGDEATSSAAPAFQFDASASEGDTATVGKATRPTARPKRKAKNPVAEIAKVVGGGVLGIALAIVGIWWGPKVFGFDGKDPFKLGPKVSSVAPWLVPEEFHGKPKDNKEEEKEKDAAKKVGKPLQGTDLHNPAKDRKNRNDNRELPKSKFSDAGNKQNISNQPKNDKEPKKDDKPPVDRTSTEFVGLRNVITSIPETVQQAINTASVALIKWDPDDDLDTEAFRKDAREAVTALGEHICYADQTDELIKPMMAESVELLQDLRGKQKKLEIVNSWAADGLKQEITDPVGILLVGEVKAIENRGSLFESRLELLTEESESITVLTKSDPSGFSPPGAKVIVIGVLVNNPAENFAGYGGDDPQVIAAGTLTLLEPLATGKSSD